MDRQVKRTYSLPEQAVGTFESVVEPGKRSAVIGSLITEWLDRRQRDRLRYEIAAGCREMADIARETAREYLPLEEELERGSNPKG
ncbi:MAG: hypothetical protein HZC36_10840 [Armatimonadetes bacterium]|nr:hypothetical protein [Armatimonadota bacterium]